MILAHLFAVFLLTLGIFTSHSSYAQTPSEPFKPDAQTLIQQGSLISIKIVKGEPLKIFIFGRKQAELKFSALETDAHLDPANFSMSVKRIDSKNTPQSLNFKREDNHFVVAEPEPAEKIYTLEVKTKHRGKEETFQFKIKNDLH